MNIFARDAQQKAELQQAYERSHEQWLQGAEAVRARNFALRQQKLGIAVRRQFEADRYGYTAALQDQQHAFQGAFEFDRDAAHHQHDIELFERQKAGRFAEQQLAQLQQQRMAEYQVGAQQRMAEYQVGAQQQMAEYQTGVQEQRDYRMEGVEQRRLGQQQEFQAGMTGFEAGVGQQRLNQQQEFAAQQDVEKMTHEVTLADMAQRGREAIEVILQRDKEGSLGREYAGKVEVVKQQNQKELDQLIFKGLESGDLELQSQEDQNDLYNEIPAARSRIRKSMYMDDAQKQEAYDQLDAREIAIRRSARFVPPEKKRASTDTRKADLIRQLPPGEQEGPWGYDAKADQLERPRGWKEPVPKKPAMTATQEFNVEREIHNEISKETEVLVKRYHEWNQNEEGKSTVTPDEETAYRAEIRRPINKLVRSRYARWTQGQQGQTQPPPTGNVPPPRRPPQGRVQLRRYDPKTGNLTDQPTGLPYASSPLEVEILRQQGETWFIGEDGKKHAIPRK
jgi:hypothetical protein